MIQEEKVKIIADKSESERARRASKVSDLRSKPDEPMPWQYLPAIYLPS